MNLAAVDRSGAADSSATARRAISSANACCTLYLALTAWPMWRWWSATHDALPPALHLAALGLAALSASPTSLPRALREWMPLLLGPFLYIELRWLIPGAGVAHADATVVGWEHALFHSDPSATLAPRLPHLALSELLHLCYASYYLLVFLPPALLFLRRRHEDFARTMLALALVYGACFATYLVFPVDGPRYLMGPALAPEGPVRALVLHLLAAGSSRGTAFPSSHVAASVVASLCALRSDRRIGIPVALLTAGLTIGTVYGGFHYAVDALAGLVTGVVAWAASRALWDALGRRAGYVAPGEQAAIAPR